MSTQKFIFIPFFEKYTQVQPFLPLSHKVAQGNTRWSTIHNYRVCADISLTRCQSVSGGLPPSEIRDFLTRWRAANALTANTISCLLPCATLCDLATFYIINTHTHAHKTICKKGISHKVRQGDKNKCLKLRDNFSRFTLCAIFRVHKVGQGGKVNRDTNRLRTRQSLAASVDLQWLSCLTWCIYNLLN